MPTHCSAFGCTNSSRKESCRKEGISYHKFPLADKMLLRRWLVNVRRADFQPTDFSYICSKHFTEENFVYQSFTNRRGLIKGAVPTKFSYNSYKPVNEKKQRKSRKNKNPENCRNDNSSEPALVGSNAESKEMQMADPALVEIFMNEKFYLPEQLAVLTNDSTKSFQSIQKISHTEEERSTSCSAPEHLAELTNGLTKSFRPKQEIRHTMEEQSTSCSAPERLAVLTNGLTKSFRSNQEIRHTMEEQSAFCSAPEHLAVLTNGLTKSFRSKQQIGHTKEERSKALKESLNAKILLRSLKKQLLDSEIKAANAKRDYYEAKTEMLSRIQDYVDLDGISDSERDSPTQKIKRRLKEEELAAEIEETVLQEQLEEAQMHAADCEKEYYEAKSSMHALSFS